MVEIYFGNRGSLSGFPFAVLDTNAQAGFGPEIVSIGQVLPGQYTYAVHNFSNDTPLGASGARVEVQQAGGAVQSFTVPAGSGRWWTVFTFDGSTGAVTPVNALSDSPPLPSAVQLRPAAAVTRGADEGLFAPLVGSLRLASRAAARLADPVGAPDADVAARVAEQDLSEQATLETRQPEVQWSAAGAEDWQGVPASTTVRAGDRVRTGAGAAARLVYFEGTVTELGPETGLLVQRLARSEGGSIVGSFFQAVGTTVSRVVQLADPNASFEIETPAATAFVRGTTPRVVVERDGRTRVENVPDGTGGLVNVRGNDPPSSIVVLLPGQQTQITPGQAPGAPAPLGPAAGAGAPQQMQQLVQQENQLVQEIMQMLATPTPTPTAQSAAQVVATLAPTSTPGPPPPACATAVGQVCTATLSGPRVSGTATGTMTGSQGWVVSLSGVPSGTLASVVFQTTAGTETIACPAPDASGATVCRGSTTGNARQGSALFVVANGTILVQGRIVSVATVTPSPTLTPGLAPGQARIVLIWGGSPRDLDAHLWVPVR